MKCDNCGNYIHDVNNNFCNNCGMKLKNTRDDSYNCKSNNKIIQDDSITFLVIGIFLSMCCSLPFGVGIILINELRYKKLLYNGMEAQANKTKKLMIILILVGITIFLILHLLNILLTIIDMGVSSNSYV